MRKNIDISVAIPNYNGLEGLKILLPGLDQLELSAIYLLDDGSTDQSVAYAKKFPRLEVIEGGKNLGPAGNRNRILQEKNLGKLLWFIDADMELISPDAPNAAEKLFEDPTIALVGGQILSMDGKSMYWNYGYDPHPMRDRVANIYGHLAKKYENNKKVHDFIRRKACKYFFGVEIDSGNHQERVVEWVAEGNFLVRTDVFRQIGGFDENMRYHEGQDLCFRIRQMGRTIKFSPKIVTKHLEIECREGRRTEDWRNGRKYFFNKHWGSPKKAFKNFFRLV
jgi:GT2 family glycosyltransferase